MLILINVKFKMIEIAVSDNMKWFAFRIIQIQSSSSYLKGFSFQVSGILGRNTYSKINCKILLHIYYSSNHHPRFMWCRNNSSCAYFDICKTLENNRRSWIFRF